MVNSKENNAVLKFIKENQRPFSCTLTISLLVSNSIKTIQNCLDSLVPLLNQVSSELIVVDTVGEEKSDGSLAIAKKYADRVIHYKWNDDFAAARNVGLKAAKGEWFLFIDDDEWFEDVSELVAFFKEPAAMKHYCALAFNKHNYFSVGSDSYNDIMVTQCTRLFKSTKFRHPIHENLHPIVSPIKHVNCYVHHYGYAGERINRKLDRNKPLMIEDLNQEPTNMHLWAQLITSYDPSIDQEREIILKDIKKAIVEFQRFKLKGPENFSNFVVVFCWKLVCLSVEKKWSAIIHQCQQFVDMYGKRLSSFQWCAIDYYLFNALINSPRIVQSRKILWDVLEDYLNKLELLEKTSQSGVDEYTPFLSDKVSYKCFYKFFNDLLQDAKVNKDWLRIRGFIRKLPLKYAEKEYNHILPVIIESVLAGDQQQIEMQYLYNLAFSKDGLIKKQNVVFAETMLKLKHDPEKRVKLEKLLAKLQGNSSYLEIQRAIFYNYDKKELQGLIRRLSKNHLINDQIDGEELFPLLIEKGVSPDYFVKKLSYNRWNQVIQTVAEKLVFDRGELLNFISKVRQTWVECISRQMLIVLLRRMYLFSNFSTITEIHKQLPIYIAETIDLGKKIYSAELFEDQDKISLLPTEFKFALKMKMALQYLSEGNQKLYLKSLRMALGDLPTSKFMISKLKWEFINKRTKVDKVDQKFELLGKQVKQQILSMLLKGENESALPLIKQLKELMPTDPETENLYKEIMKRI
ncbi:glycosyltransferase [Liquorilactobacillus sicerae]|uniref:glycosyltransferase n=1 Tax=Liquorilactobacillus sicerae TaxID=1416943 RepID=UPI00247FA85C|nr:glycosyltransferase [Liquorilactobacillus sicerae]